MRNILMAALIFVMVPGITAAFNLQDKIKLESTRSCEFCDLSDINLDGQSLAGAHLKGANLNSASIKNADLSGIDLGDARFEQCKFIHVETDKRLHDQCNSTLRKSWQS